MSLAAEAITLWVLSAAAVIALIRGANSTTEQEQ